MPNPNDTQTQTKKTIKTLRKATTAYIYAIRKASKSMWFPDIKDASTVAEMQVNCMEAIDEANQKFLG